MPHRWSVNVSTKLPKDSLYSHSISKWWRSKCHTEKKKTRRSFQIWFNVKWLISRRASRRPRCFILSRKKKAKPLCVFFLIFAASCMLVRWWTNLRLIYCPAVTASLGIRALTCWKECESQETWVSFSNSAHMTVLHYWCRGFYYK